MGGTPVSIGGALHDALRLCGLAHLIPERKLRDGWERVVGEKAATVAALEMLRDGVLHVRVGDAAWRNELHYQREAIRAAANALLGAELVREVRLR